jgi:hypothetical protein
MAIFMVKPPGLDFSLQIYMGRSQFISLLETLTRRRIEDGGEDGKPGY